MESRYKKKVTVNGTMVLHQHYLYWGYLQIAAIDLMRANAPTLWLLHWDPIKPISTRPLSLRKNGTWYTYGYDLTKNVTELYTTAGAIVTEYDYTPYGAVTATGLEQPIQWSSEHYDAELGMVYYNYRHYNPLDGRWINRDPIMEQGGYNLYGFVRNNCIWRSDWLGAAPWSQSQRIDNEQDSAYMQLRLNSTKKQPGYCGHFRYDRNIDVATFDSRRRGLFIQIVNINYHIVTCETPVPHEEQIVVRQIQEAWLYTSQIRDTWTLADSSVAFNSTACKGSVKMEATIYFIDSITDLGNPLAPEDSNYDAQSFPLMIGNPKPHMADRKNYEFERRITTIGGRMVPQNSGQNAIGLPIDVTNLRPLLDETLSITWDCCNGRKKTIIKS